MQNITFKPPLKTIKKDEKIINILPFSIHYEGNADVDIYFNSKSKPLNELDKNLKGVLKNSFRGRSLKGKEIKMDKNILGVIYRKDQKKQMNFEYTPKEFFTSFRYWNHDDLPENYDKLNEMISYLNVTNEVNQETLI